MACVPFFASSPEGRRRPRKVTRSPSGGLPRPSPVRPSHVYSGGALSHEVLVPGLSGPRLLAGAGPGSQVRRPGTAMRAAGVFVDSSQLSPGDAPALVRVTDGQADAGHGPPPGSGPQPSAHFVIDCPDLRAALGWAARIPAASYSTAEVRPHEGQDHA